MVREWVAESRIQLEALRLLVLKTAWLMDTVGNRQAMTEIQAIKIAVPRAVQQILDRAIQVFGGAGVSGDTPLAEHVRRHPYPAPGRRPRRGAPEQPRPGRAPASRLAVRDAGDHAAVDDELGAAGEAEASTGEEHDGAGDVVRHAGSAERDVEVRRGRSASSCR